MGRPFGTKNKVQETIKTVDSAGNVVNEETKVKFEDSPQDAAYVATMKALDEERAKLEKEKQELEELKKRYEVKPIEECMKDPHYGSTLYVQIRRAVGKNAKGEDTFVPAAISCFPDTIDKRTGEYVAKDIGFDSREQADEYRNSKEIKCIYNGKEVSINDAVWAQRREYHRKRIEGDKKVLEQQSVR